MITAALGVLQQRTLLDGIFKVVRDPAKRPGHRKVGRRCPPCNRSLASKKMQAVR